MEMQVNPANLPAANDFKLYKQAFGNAEAKKEIRDKLLQVVDHDGNPKYQKNTPDGDFQNAGPYCDFALGGSDRLGGQLDTPTPGFNVPEPTPGTQVMIRNHATGQDVPVKVRGDGAVIYHLANGQEDPDAHHYMHHVFDHIMYQTRDKLEAINLALDCYNNAEV